MASALFGFYFPTSIAGVISTPLSLGAFIGPALILLCLIKPSKWQWRRVPYLLFFFAFLLIFTIVSPFNYVSWGGLAPYILISVVFLVDFKSEAWGGGLFVDRLLLWIVVSVNIFIFVLGFGILVEDAYLLEFLGNNYQAISNSLFEQMVFWGLKPVTIFGSHSTAAFAYFSLFILSLKIIFVIGLSKVYKLFFLLSSFGFFVLNYLLFSNASVFVSILMLMTVIVVLNRIIHGPEKIIFYFLVIVGFLISVYYFDLSQLIFGDSRDNGILARYGSGGRLQGTYDYLLDNYFMPIGLSYSLDIALGDNFIAEYIIKSSVVGYILLLLLLWTWLRRHLIYRTAIMFFLFFLITDFAYPLLVYSRVAATLPFFVLVWSRLDSKSFLKKAVREHGDATSTSLKATNL